MLLCWEKNLQEHGHVEMKWKRREREIEREWGLFLRGNPQATAQISRPEPIFFSLLFFPTAVNHCLF